MAAVPQRKRSGRAAATAPTEVRTRRKAAGSAHRSADNHGRELWGLAVLGVAVFLTFVLVVGSGGGVLGGAAAGALEIALGRMAFLIPLSLLVVAVVLLVRIRITIAGAMVGGGVLILFSLFTLLAAGFPPLGSGHEPSEFVTAVYRMRAGWVGEALFVGISRLVGSVGVALIGWFGLIAGVSLVTGWTLRSVAATTRSAAHAVGSAAATHVMRRSGGRDEHGPLDDPYLTGFGPAEHPEEVEPDEEWATWPDETVYAGPGAPPDLKTMRRPTLRVLRPSDRPVHLHDAATDFPDFYRGQTDESTVLLRETTQPRDIADSGEAIASLKIADPGETAILDDPADLGDGIELGEIGEAGEEVAAAGDGSAAAGALSGEGGLEKERDDTVAREQVDEPAAAQVQYLLPEPEFLQKTRMSNAATTQDDREIAALLVETLAHFGVTARVSGTVVGPRVTRYELQLAPGTKVSKVTNLKDDIAYALASTEIRILAPIPGKSAIGVEVPNQRPDFVKLGDIFREFPASAGPLMVWLGKDISGKAVYTDLTKMPHLLIAGTTGSGKSGCINCIISSVLLRSTPDEVRLVLIDPKKVELSHYERIPHLLVPVVTNMKSAAGVLANLVREMDERYTLMEMVKARNLEETNRARRRRGEPLLPYLLVVIDELADLMMVSPAEVEEYVIRLAQKARAVGIHLVVATQRPSADVITGMIKANIPSRIAFAVSSQTDSRVILDVNGAEALLGLGDMLFKPLGSSRLQRVQGAFITEEEIHMLVTHWRQQAEPTFREELLQTPEEAMAEEAIFDPDTDDLIADAAELVMDTGNASVSMLQRRLRVGYTRAGRLIDMLERRGIVGPYEGSKPRQVLVNPLDRDRVLEALHTEVQSGRPQQMSLTDMPAEDEEGAD
ncbi:MAG: DNA translocase FtsK [Actinobacteria bacterium]|nr:DNA translocase FtsK [Actinomycetota bacterium]